MFEIKNKTKVTVSIYGEEFNLFKPTVEQVELLQDDSDVTSLSAKEQFNRICGVLEVLGLPKSFSSKMEIDHLIDLVGYLTNALGTNKKKEPEAGV